MSEIAKRVLDALIEYDACDGNGYPITSIHWLFDDENSTSIDEALTADEEKQVIQAFSY